MRERKTCSGVSKIEERTTERLVEVLAAASLEHNNTKAFALPYHLFHVRDACTRPS